MLETDNPRIKAGFYPGVNQPSMMDFYEIPFPPGKVPVRVMAFLCELCDLCVRLLLTLQQDPGLSHIFIDSQ